MFNFPPSEIAGFTDAATGERLDFSQVKEHATRLCTALVKRYALKETDTVSLFSQNTIWYPVAMFAVLRAGSLDMEPSSLTNAPGVEISQHTYAHKPDTRRLIKLSRRASQRGVAGVQRGRDDRGSQNSAFQVHHDSPVVPRSRPHRGTERRNPARPCLLVRRRTGRLHHDEAAFRDRQELRERRTVPGLSRPKGEDE